MGMKRKGLLTVKLCQWDGVDATSSFFSGGIVKEELRRESTMDAE